VWVVDLERAEVAAFLRFEGSVQEIFDVQVLPGATWPEIAEPDADVVGSAFVLPDAAMTELRAGGARH